MEIFCLRGNPGLPCICVHPSSGPLLIDVIVKHLHISHGKSFVCCEASMHMPAPRHSGADHMVKDALPRPEPQCRADRVGKYCTSSASRYKEGWSICNPTGSISSSGSWYSLGETNTS